MPHDPNLAERIRQALKRRQGIGERKMFGGICFMVSGHMACGVAGQDLMLRLGEEGASTALTEAHVRPMDFTGRPMKSMVYVAPTGLQSDDALRSWLDRAVGFARSLPPKKPRRL